MIPKFLYHGSPNYIEGEVEPRQGKDINNKPEKNLFGIYATNNLEIAISKAILSCPGIRELTYLNSERKNPPYGIIFSGWPEAEHIYIYKLPIATFKPVSKHSWVSPAPVMPIDLQILQVRDYIHVVRKATLLEKIHLFFKYGPRVALRYLGFNKL